MRADCALPQRWEKRQRASHRQGPRQVWGLLGCGQAQRRVGARGVGMVVGMARRIQHHGRGKPLRRVPRMARCDGFQPPIVAGGAGQAVVLDVIRQHQLHLRVERQSGPDQDTPSSRKHVGTGKRQRRSAQIHSVRMQPAPRLRPRPQRVFLSPAARKAAAPCAQEEPIKPLTCPGRIGIVRAGSVLG